MTKRLLMLDDDEIERALEWYHAAFGGDHPRDADEEDDELADRLRDLRLKA